MFDYDERGELAPRDVVSKSIVARMEETRQPNVYLDVSHLDANFVRQRFPGIAESCAKFGIDITRERIPVRPGAHYMIGGITVDRDGRTTIPRLWAAGEVTSSGLHGANRLASNSLLEGLVFGANCGRGASAAAKKIPDDFRALPITHEVVGSADEELDVADIRNSLKSLMWRDAGILRERARLAAAAASIAAWCQYVLPRQFREPSGWELQNLLTVARLMVEAALAREESRGVHQRIDFPDQDDAKWKRHIAWKRAAEPESAPEISVLT
jgi:L-aspartate oxidase